MNDYQPPEGGGEEIDLQGLRPEEIAEIFSQPGVPSPPSPPPPAPANNQPPPAPVDNQPPPAAEPAPRPEAPPPPGFQPESPKSKKKPENPAEAIDQLPEFSSAEKGKKWKEKISSRRDLIRQQLAGVDPVPPKSGIVLQADPNDPFIKLLRPLPQSEILALSAEVAKDDTVFHQVEKERRNQFRSHNLGAFLTALSLVIFALAVGPQFVTETLTNANIPGWVPIDWPTEIVSGVLFVIGLLVPIIAGLALLDGFRWLLSAAGGSGLRVLSLAFPGLICAPLALLLVSQGSVLAAVVVLIIYWAVSVVIRSVSNWGRPKWKGKSDGS